MRRMTVLEKWKEFKAARNRCLILAFTIGITGLIGVAMLIQEPNLDKLAWGAKVGLCTYVIIIGAFLALAIVYDYRMRKIVKSV